MNKLRQLTIVFFIFVFGNYLRATGVHNSFLELLPNKVEANATFKTLAKKKLGYFEQRYVEMSKNIFAQVEIPNSQKKINFIPNLPLNISVNNNIVGTSQQIKYRYTSIAAHYYKAQISIELGNSIEDISIPREFGKVNSLFEFGNQVTVSLISLLNKKPNLIASAYDYSMMPTIDNQSHPKAHNILGGSFYRPTACQLSTNISQTSCVDNNDGTFTTNFDLNINWIDGPSEDIQVLVNGVVAQTIPSGNTSPQTVAIALGADGLGQDTIITTFATTTTCADTLILKSPNPCPDNVATCSSATGCLGGNAFEDFNCNGIDDTSEDGIQGVQVVVYDCQNNAIDTVWTDSDGDWQLCGLTDGVAYRVEFILPENIACWASPTHAGSDNGTDIQFLTVPACTKFGLSNPKDYCEVDPFVIVPCYSMGAYDGATSGEPAIVKFRESADGHDFTGTTKTGDFEAVTLADHNDVGAVYGVAWQPTKERYYLSAYHKRYVGFGPDGPDAIYQYDLTGNKTGTINLDAVLATTNSAGSDVHDFTPAGGGDPHPGEVYDLGAGDISFDGVGKRAFGDMEMSDDDSTLYVINLFDKKIYALNVTSGNTASTTITQTWDAPDATNADRHRPFALAFHQGKLWVGSVDENGTNAYVHSILPTGTAFNLELTIPLNYSRQAFINYASSPTSLSDWNPWATTATVSYNGNTLTAPPEIGYPQAILSDIEFAANGDMILGFRDRFGDQSGAGVYLNPDETALSFSISAGDILKACFQSGNFVLETGGGSCAGAGGVSPSGPGGAEFYSWDLYNFEDPWSPIKPDNTNPITGYVSGGFHWETTQGALLQLKSKSYVMTTAMDPFSDYSGGVLKFNNTTGGREGVALDSANYADLVGGYTLFDTEDFPLDPSNITFGKANGLGDLEGACESAPLEIGNYVWCDSVQNGIQDACERGIDTMIVRLYDSNDTLIGQDTTINGRYYFNQYNVDTSGITVDGSGIATPNTAWSGLAYSTEYNIVFGYGQYDTASGTFRINATTYNGFTTANANGNDNIDSDVVAANYLIPIGSKPRFFPVINMTTAPMGCGDHKYDLGLICGDYDYGDLPDIANGTTGVTDYETYDSTGGPSHQIVTGLFLGDTVDIDTDGFPDAQALGDDNDKVDDEDGVTIFTSLSIIPGGNIRLPLAVTNTTGDTAYLEAWIDWNGDGDFEEGNEMVVDLKDNKDGVFPSFLSITIPTDAVKGVKVGFRIRLSNEDNMTPYGRVASGEIEDYLLGINCPENICLPVDIQINKE